MRRTTISTTAILIALASPLAAQDFCGGKGAGGQWIGGTEDASDITTSAAYQEQMASC